MSYRASLNPVPSDDVIVKLIYEQIKILRTSQVSTRDIVNMMSLKQNKMMSANSISFWQGAKDLLTESIQIKAFGEIDYFRDFLEYVNQNLFVQEMAYVKATKHRI